MKLNSIFATENMDRPVENVLIGAMNTKDAMQFLQNNSLMIIPGDRDDMIDAICRVNSGNIRAKKGCRVSGVILSGGIMPKNRSMSCLEKSKIPVLITKEDTYKIAARVNSMVVKLKPQDTEKIKIIVDMVEKYVDIDKVLANLK